jgi:hypothetical protein
MKTIVMFLIFLGALLMIKGIYEQKYDTLKKNVRVEYRFIPRTYYEEQLEQNADVSTKFKNMFGKESPWFERTVTLSKEDKTDLP